MTRKIKTAKSIIAQLDALCTDVLDNTKKAQDTIDKSDKKLLAFMEKFLLNDVTKYRSLIKKYCTISGYSSISLEAQHVSTAAGTANHLYMDLSIPETGPDTGATQLELVWHAYKDTKLLSMSYNTDWGNNYKIFTKTSDSLFREKLAVAVQYIKSGKFEQDFVNRVTQACKDRLAKNATMTATASVNNRI